MTNSRETYQKKQFKNETSLNGQTSKFTHEEVMEALLGVEDLMARCLTEDSMLILGDLGKAIKEDYDFEGPEMWFGLEKRYLTPEVMDTIRNYTPVGTDVGEKGFKTTYGKVPVRFQFIHRRYPFFSNPERKATLYGDHNLPNPFANYYKARWIVQ